MVRRYRRVSRKRTYYRKKKWTAYNTELSVSSAYQVAGNSNIEYGAPAVYGSSNSLANNAGPEAPLSAISYYVCRCRFSGIFYVGGAGYSYIFYLCYIPNAVTIDSNNRQNTSLKDAYFYLHPEYVLAWKRMDYVESTGDTGEVSLYSRITKRLAPGDRIAVYCLTINTTGDAKNVANVQGTFSCYVRTN